MPGRIGLTAICALAVTLVAPAAGANAKKIPTRVVLTRVGDFDKQFGYNVLGKIKSPNRTCRHSRTLNLDYKGGVKSTKSTQSGAFGLDLPENKEGVSKFPFTGGTYSATLPRKGFGPRKHRKVCKPDSAVFTVNDIPGSSGVEGIDFDDGTNTFSGDIDIAPPCDESRTWDLYSTEDNVGFEDLSDGDPGTDGNQRVPLAASGDWSFTLSTEPVAGLEYDAYVYQRLTYAPPENGNLTMRQCGAIDTADYTPPT